MINKRKITALISEKLNGGPLTDYRKFHPNVIGSFVDIVLNSIIAEDVRQAKLSGDDGVASDWIQTIYNIPLRWDGLRQQVYLEWQVEVLLLDTQGIREINWRITGTERGFNIIRAGEDKIYADLPCSDPEATGQMAAIEGKRVYFPGMPRSYYTKKRKLMAKVILAAAGYDEDQVLPIPEERMKEALFLLDDITKDFKLTRMKVSNDSNPNTI